MAVLGVIVREDQKQDGGNTVLLPAASRDAGRGTHMNSGWEKLT